MGREGFERYERCPLVQHGYHWAAEGEVSQPIKFHHRQSLNYWQRGASYQEVGGRSPDAEPQRNKGKRPRHALDRWCMHEGTHSSPAAVEK